jgi:EAL domain-containing protein (putative c-di-GMP-specific phosphodiesterase class I)
MSDSSLPSPEAFLVDYVRRLERRKDGVGAIHVHFSKLLPFNRRDHHIRTAINAFEEIVPVVTGRIFTLSNQDLIFIFDAAEMDEVNAVIFRLKFLFNDDPLISDGKDESGAPATFTDYYDVAQQYKEFLHLTQLLVRANANRPKVVSKAAERHNDHPEFGDDRAPLTPKILGRIDESLRRADLSNLMRRQAICAVVGDANPTPVFHELFISIKDLQETLLPDVNVLSNRWLFQHLTEILDRRMLSLLTRSNDASVTGSVSINLNVSTLLSPDFLTFDSNVKAGQRGTIVLELQKIDIFADLGAFFFARDFCRDRGYRICIDGISYLSLPYINRNKLGVDMIKMLWDPEMENMDEEHREAMRAAVAESGDTRVILCRCDDERAIKFGHSINITMFQGRHVEHLMSERTKK